MRYLIATLLLAIGTNAHAEVSWKEKCATIARIATSVMELRQASAPMADVMKTADGNSAMETMIIQAYEVPRFSTAENKKRAASDFSETWYLTCVRVLRDKK